jgi:hypothetical protein
MLTDSSWYKLNQASLTGYEWLTNLIPNLVYSNSLIGSEAYRLYYVAFVIQAYAMINSTSFLNFNTSIINDPNNLGIFQACGVPRSNKILILKAKIWISAYNVTIIQIYLTFNAPNFRILSIYMQHIYKKNMTWPPWFPIGKKLHIDIENYLRNWIIFAGTLCQMHRVP